MFSWNKSKILAPIKSITTDYHNFSRYRSLNQFINLYGLLSNVIDYRLHLLSMHTGKRKYKLTWLLEKGSVSCKRWSDFNLLWNLSKRHLKNRTFELELVGRAFVRVVEHESKNEVVTFAICPLNLTPLKELRHKIYQNSNSGTATKLSETYRCTCRVVVLHTKPLVFGHLNRLTIVFALAVAYTS